MYTPRSMEGKNYYVIAYYYFTTIENPDLEVKKHKEFFKNRNITSRIYISHEGINAQMSGLIAHAEEYMAWMRSDPRFSDIDFKIHAHHENVFPRAAVRVRKQLVALDVAVDPKESDGHLEPKEWNEMLDQRDEDTLIIDVRNDYEWEIGHFEGAELPKLAKFREFPEYAKRLKEERDPKKTKVMMYCTGGIRCELYSVLLKKEGFEQVYQLQGGVIGYGLKNGSDHWKGKLFVFDDRLAVALNDEEDVEPISSCFHCEAPSDVYYNCANMDCNELFLCCPACAERLQGCCCQECISAPRVRPYQKVDKPKPFKRLCECT
ncbi:MAG: rhodanese-related sulfurtransferase [Chlamydiota bacterium]